MMLPDGWRFRVSLLGKVVLQRRYRLPGMRPGLWDMRWRDASSTDLDLLFREAGQ